LLTCISVFQPERSDLLLGFETVFGRFVQLFENVFATPNLFIAYKILVKQKFTRLILKNIDASN